MNSSHAVAPLGRLLWKEYRTQRSLWLVMLALGVVPQILMRFSIGEPAVRVVLVWVLVGVLPFLFVIGSTAILFAGEREERTVDWLVNLAAPPHWTLLAKWLFVFVATAALAVTLAITALLLVWSGPFIEDSAQWSYERFSDEGGEFRWMFVFIGMFLWGALGSLVSRRVVTAVAAAGFWWVMTFVVPFVAIPSLLGFSHNGPGYSYVQDRVAILSFLAVGLADLGLGWCWCQGRYLDATVFDGIILQIAARWSRLRGRTTVKVRLPNRVEFDSPWRREWQRLIWQERCRDRYHRNLLYLGCVVSLVLAILGGTYSGDIVPLILPLIVVSPMAMGILGFRYDGEGLPLRFLSNRGVEARILWLAKHAVWFPRAIWIPLSIWLLAATLQALLPARIPKAPGNDLLRQAGALSEYPGGAFAFVLLTYGCGQLAAILFRRTILAIVVGFTASLLSTLWLLFAILLRVPLWWSMGGLIVWMYAVTWLSIPSWLIERPLVGRLQRVVAFVAPPLLLVAVWGAWRAYEIPGFYSNILSPKQSFEQIQLAKVHKEQLEHVTDQVSPSDQQFHDRLALLMGGFNKEQDFIQGLHRDGFADVNAPDDPVEAFWHHNEPRLKELLEITSGARGPSARRGLGFAKTLEPLMPQQMLLLEAGRLRTREGRLEDAFQYYAASLRLASFWATGRGLGARREAQDQQLLTLDGIVQWASHPGQTSEKLRAARGRLQAEFERFPSIDEVLVAQHTLELEMLDETVQLGARWNSGASYAWQLLVIDYFRFLPWERVRAKRWLEQELLDRDQVARDVSAMLREPGVDVGRRLDQIELYHLIRLMVDKSYWEATTPLVSMIGGRRNEVASMLIDGEVAMRESLLALSLLAWKLDHQQWPETLVESIDRWPTVTAIDPWCGETFRYDGSLLNQHQEDGSPVFVLSTVGQFQLREVQIGYVNVPSAATELRTWAGVRVVHDDRLRLKLDQGKLSFQLPHHLQAAHDGSKRSN